MKKLYSAEDIISLGPCHSYDYVRKHFPHPLTPTEVMRLRVLLHDRVWVLAFPHSLCTVDECAKFDAVAKIFIIKHSLPSCTSLWCIARDLEYSAGKIPFSTFGRHISNHKTVRRAFLRMMSQLIKDSTHV